MTAATPRFESAPAAQAPAVRLLGDWTAAQFAQPRLFRQLSAALPPAKQDLEWDLREAGALDHLGAQLLWAHWERRWPAKVELLPAHQAVLKRVAEYTLDAPSRRRKGWRDLLAAFGSTVLRGVSHLTGFLKLLGMLTLDLRQLVRAPHEAPWRDFSGH